MAALIVFIGLCFAGAGFMACFFVALCREARGGRVCEVVLVEPKPAQYGFEIPNTRPGPRPADSTKADPKPDLEISAMKDIAVAGPPSGQDWAPQSTPLWRAQ